MDRVHGVFRRLLTQLKAKKPERTNGIDFRHSRSRVIIMPRDLLYKLPGWVGLPPIIVLAVGN